MRRLTVVLCLLIGAAIVARADWQSAATHAEISGRVIVASGEATPLARALVTISGPTLTPSRTVITDDEGRFAFRTLPPGRFTIVAARPPFVPTAFGAKRPGRPGTPIELAAGQRKADISIRLVRGSAIAGMIRTSDGASAVGIKVEVTPLDVQYRLDPDDGSDR